MAANNAMQQMNRRKVPGAIKTTLVALALIAACIVGLNLAENSGQSVHAGATAAPSTFASTTANGFDAPNNRMSNEDFLSSNLNDKISMPPSGPRECSPQQGIVNDCIYQ